MKRFVKIFYVCIAVCLCAIIFSGCAIGPNINTLGQNYALDNSYKEFKGIKACYKPTSYNYELMYAEYGENLLANLTKHYGFVSDKPLFTDSIRYQLALKEDGINYQVIANSGWKWQPYYNESVDSANIAYITLDENGNEKDDTKHEALAGYLGLDIVKNSFQVYYRNCFITIYNTALNIVIYQILLGETPTIFPNINEMVEVVGSTIKVKDSYNQLLNEYTNKYNHKGSYVGFTALDKTKLANYILSNVIGDEIVAAYSTTIDSYVSKDYTNTISTLINQIPDWDESVTKQNFFNPFAASYFKDYEANSFFIGSGNESFSHIPEAEYQSLLVMPNVNKSLMEVWISFEAKSDLDVRVGIRMFHKASSTLFEKLYGTYSIKGGKFSWANSNCVIMLPCKNNQNKQIHLPLTVFDNNIDKGTLNTTSTENGYKLITPIKEAEHNYSTSNFYKLRMSSNGFGGTAVLDEQIFIDNDFGNFYEVFFDVVKKPQDALTKDYSFKVAISGLYYST